MNSLVRKWQKHVFFRAGSRGHMLLIIVKLVVAGLAASDELSKWVLLCDEKKPRQVKTFLEAIQHTLLLCVI